MQEKDLGFGATEETGAWKGARSSQSLGPGWVAVWCQRLPGNLSRGSGGPREPRGVSGAPRETRGGGARGSSVAPGAPGEPEQRCWGPQRTRGSVGGSWGNQGRWGWGGGLPGNLANTLRVPAGLRRAGGGTGRNQEGKGRKRARTKQECFSRSFPDYQPHPGAVGSCLLRAAAAKQRKPGSQAEAVERRGPASRRHHAARGPLPGPATGLRLLQVQDKDAGFTTSSDLHSHQRPSPHK